MSTLTTQAPPVPRVRAPARVDVVLLALAALVFVVPFEGFWLVRSSLGFNPVKWFGYLVFCLVATRLGKALVCQSIALPLVAITFLLGTVIAVDHALRNGTALPYEVLTSWQMVGLWLIVSYGFFALRERLAHVFLVGSFIVLAVYVLLYHAGYRITENEKRVVWVAGFQANQVGITAGIYVAWLVSTHASLEPRLRRVLLWIGGPLSIYALLLSSSRGSILALGAALAVALLPIRARGQPRRSSRLLVLVALVVLAGAVMGFGAFGERVGHHLDRWSGGFAGSTPHRAAILEAAVAIAGEQPLGLGLGNAKHELGARIPFAEITLIDSHSEYLRVLMECGWLGLAFFMTGWLVLLVRATRLWWRGEAAWPLVVLVFLGVAAASATLGPSKHTWIVVGIVAGELCRRRRSHELPPPEERRWPSG